MQQGASVEKWYLREPAPDYAPSPPALLAVGSEFAAAAWALGIIITLAGLIPIVLFIAWALTPQHP